MSAALRSVRLVWPREVTTEQVVTAMRLLTAVGGRPVVLEATGHGGRVEHRLRVAESRSAGVTRQLRGTIPGLGIESVEADDPYQYSRAVELRLSTTRRALRFDRAMSTSRAVLSALAPVGRDEVVVLQWTLLRPLPAAAVPNRIEYRDESLLTALLRAPFDAPRLADSESRSALRAKRSQAGWRAIGRVAVRAASTSRQQQLLAGVVQALRTAEGPGVQVRSRRTSPGRLARVGGSGSLRLNSDELSAMCAWPVGRTAELPVIATGSRRLPATSAVPRTGRVVGRSTWTGKGERPLALSIEDSLRHLHVLGPTGVGKSTLLLGLIAEDMAAGRGVVVVEPKGDLIREVLARVPKHRLDDVVLIDPTDTEAAVGINPLAAGGRSPELVADQLLAAFHGLYAANWGPRTSDILHAGLLTLARSADASLVSLPLLLTNPAYRRRLVGDLDDPVGLGGFWAGFEAWSDAERTAAIAPVMNKLRPFLTRPSLRRIVSQVRPKLDLASVFSQRRILLVDLAVGELGPEAAHLMGALVMSSLWRTAQGRARLAPEQRDPVSVYLDEFQDFLHLPTDLAAALAAARGLGVSFNIAHQALAQLTPSVKAAVLANARSRICFQLGADDARTLAQGEPLLSAEDFSSLPTFHFYARLVAGGSVQPWCSGRSLQPAAGRTDAETVRSASRRNYAATVLAIDEEIERLVRPFAQAGGTIGPRRRGPAGGAS